MKRRVSGIAVFLCVCLLASFAESDEAADSSGELAWMSLPPEAKRPEVFEPHLLNTPDDGPSRTAALIWYSRRTNNFARLRHHTLKMIEHHPDNMYIYFANFSEFYAKPEYQAEVVGRLEQQLEENPSSGGYWVLAQSCQRRALPFPSTTEQEKQRWLTYYGLSEDADIPTTTNDVLVAKTIDYFRKAIALTGDDRWHHDFYARQLVDFYSRIAKHEAAISLCQSLAKRKENASDPDILLSYGTTLGAAGRRDEAKTWLAKVRENDHEGIDGGPGCTTMRAETQLGLIEFEQGRVEQAEAHLLSSANVQKCCHNTTKGFPTSLARKLLDAGRASGVREYCMKVLDGFTPHSPEFGALLAEAEKVLEEAEQPPERDK